MPSTKRLQDGGQLVIWRAVLAPPREKTSHRCHGLSIAGSQNLRVVMPRPDRWKSVGKERFDGDAIEFGTTLEEGKLNQDCKGDDVSPKC